MNGRKSSFPVGGPATLKITVYPFRSSVTLLSQHFELDRWRHSTKINHPTKCSIQSIKSITYFPILIKVHTSQSSFSGRSTNSQVRHGPPSRFPPSSVSIPLVPVAPKPEAGPTSGCSRSCHPDVRRCSYLLKKAEAKAHQVNNNGSRTDDGKHGLPWVGLWVKREGSNLDISRLR